MKSIVELINKVRKRPAMYLGKPYISCFKSYLDGWMLDRYDSVNDFDVMIDFQKWIEQKFAIQSSHSWADIILFYSEGEVDALNNFSIYFDEYLLL